MFKRLNAKVAVLNSVVALSYWAGLMQPTLAGSESNQSDVDAVKTSKDDHQHQVKPSKNSYKKGTPLSFEGPPVQSKETDDKRAKKSFKGNKQ